MRELEIQLEEERSQRSQAMSSKKQLDAELQESEAQLETTTRGKEEATKQLRRLQVRQSFVSPSQLPIFKILFFVTGSIERSSA